MPREPNKKAEEAKQLYHKGIPLVDIAKKLDVPAGTVRRWKSTYNWDNKNQSERSDKKANIRNKSKNKNEPAADEVESVLKNTELTEKQRLFCLHFVKSFNATKAYQKAYGCDYTTAMVNGPRLLGNARVKEQIQQLKQERLNREFLSEADIFQKYMDIAFADITDFMMFGNEEIELTDKAGNQRTVTVSHVNIKNDYEVDGTIISEVSQGKDRIKVKLADRMKALGWLAAHMDIATPEQKAKVELLQAQKMKLEADNTDDTGIQKKLDNMADILTQIKPITEDDVSG